jgi:hypothetical protein
MSLRAAAAERANAAFSNAAFVAADETEFRAISYTSQGDCFASVSRFQPPRSDRRVMFTTEQGTQVPASLLSFISLFSQAISKAPH